MSFPTLLRIEGLQLWVLDEGRKVTFHSCAIGGAIKLDRDTCRHGPT